MFGRFFWFENLSKDAFGFGIHGITFDTIKRPRMVKDDPLALFVLSLPIELARTLRVQEARWENLADGIGSVRTVEFIGLGRTDSGLPMPKLYRLLPFVVLYLPRFLLAQYFFMRRDDALRWAAENLRRRRLGAGADLRWPERPRSSAISRSILSFSASKPISASSMSLLSAIGRDCTIIGGKVYPVLTPPPFGRGSNRFAFALS